MNPNEIRETLTKILKRNNATVTEPVVSRFVNAISLQINNSIIKNRDEINLFSELAIEEYLKSSHVQRSIHRATARFQLISPLKSLLLAVVTPKTNPMSEDQKKRLADEIKSHGQGETFTIKTLETVLNEPLNAPSSNPVISECRYLLRTDNSIFKTILNSQIITQNKHQINLASGNTPLHRQLAASMLQSSLITRLFQWSHPSNTLNGNNLVNLAANQPHLIWKIVSPPKGFAVDYRTRLSGRNLGQLMAINPDIRAVILNNSELKRRVERYISDPDAAKKMMLDQLRIAVRNSIQATENSSNLLNIGWLLSSPHGINTIRDALHSLNADEQKIFFKDHVSLFLHHEALFKEITVDRKLRDVMLHATNSGDELAKLYSMHSYFRRNIQGNEELVGKIVGTDSKIRPASSAVLFNLLNNFKEDPDHKKFVTRILTEKSVRDRLLNAAEGKQLAQLFNYEEVKDDILNNPVQLNKMLNSMPNEEIISRLQYPQIAEMVIHDFRHSGPLARVGDPTKHSESDAAVITKLEAKTNREQLIELFIKHSRIRDAIKEKTPDLSSLYLDDNQLSATTKKLWQLWGTNDADMQESLIKHDNVWQGMLGDADAEQVKALWGTKKSNIRDYISDNTELLSKVLSVLNLNDIEPEQVMKLFDNQWARNAISPQYLAQQVISGNVDLKGKIEKDSALFEKALLGMQPLELFKFYIQHPDAQSFIDNTVSLENKITDFKILLLNHEIKANELEIIDKIANDYRHDNFINKLVNDKLQNLNSEQLKKLLTITTPDQLKNYLTDISQETRSTIISTMRADPELRLKLYRISDTNFLLEEYKTYHEDMVNDAQISEIILSDPNLNLEIKQFLIYKNPKMLNSILKHEQNSDLLNSVMTDPELTLNAIKTLDSTYIKQIFLAKNKNSSAIRKAILGDEIKFSSMIRACQIDELRKVYAIAADAGTISNTNVTSLVKLASFADGTQYYTTTALFTAALKDTAPEGLKSKLIDLAMRNKDVKYSLFLNDDTYRSNILKDNIKFGNFLAPLDPVQLLRMLNQRENPEIKQFILSDNIHGLKEKILSQGSFNIFNKVFQGYPQVQDTLRNDFRGARVIFSTLLKENMAESPHSGSKLATVFLQLENTRTAILNNKASVYAMLNNATTDQLLAMYIKSEPFRKNLLDTKKVDKKQNLRLLISRSIEQQTLKYLNTAIHEAFDYTNKDKSHLRILDYFTPKEVFDIYSGKDAEGKRMLETLVKGSTSGDPIAKMVIEYAEENNKLKELASLVVKDAQGLGRVLQTVLAQNMQEKIFPLTTDNELKDLFKTSDRIRRAIFKIPELVDRLQTLSAKDDSLKPLLEGAPGLGAEEQQSQFRQR